MVKKLFRNELVELIAQSIERYKMRGYEWTDEQFEIWWKHDRWNRSHEERYAEAEIALDEVLKVMQEPTKKMQQVVSANWGRRSWADFQEVIKASPLVHVKQNDIESLDYVE